jgi:hypothetical protein
MKSIKFGFSSGISGDTREEIVEYEDYVTEIEIESDLKEWVYDKIDFWWEEQPERKEDI